MTGLRPLIILSIVCLAGCSAAPTQVTDTADREATLTPVPVPEDAPESPQNIHATAPDTDASEVECHLQLNLSNKYEQQQYAFTQTHERIFVSDGKNHTVAVVSLNESKRSDALSLNISNPSKKDLSMFLEAHTVLRHAIVITPINRTQYPARVTVGTGNYAGSPGVYTVHMEGQCTESENPPPKVHAFEKSNPVAQSSASSSTALYPPS